MKTDSDERITTRAQGNANNLESSMGSASIQAPDFSISSGNVCDRRIDLGDGSDREKHREDMNELEFRQILRESYTRQTIIELITLRSDDNKGSNDPFTKFVHAFYSPADEFDKAINLLDNLPQIRNSLDEALMTGAPDKIQAAAEQIVEGVKNIPSAPITGLPKSKTDVLKIYGIIKMLYRQYEAFLVEQLFEGGCDKEDQIKSKVGKITEWDFFSNKLVFYSSNGQGTMVAGYYDVPKGQYWQDDNTGIYYVKASYLPQLEAKVNARK